MFYIGKKQRVVFRKYYLNSKLKVILWKLKKKAQGILFFFLIKIFKTTLKYFKLRTSYFYTFAPKMIK